MVFCFATFHMLICIPPVLEALLYVANHIRKVNIDKYQLIKLIVLIC